MHLKDVKIILATSVSGSLNIDWGPGSYILLEQFLNFSNGRKDSFYPLDSKLAHVDVTEPYCMETHKYLRQAAEDIGLNLCRGGVYSCFNGPRFETKAEIEMVRRLGGNLVGQTGYPECVLARELAISYASVAVVSNMAAGIKKELTVQEVSLNLENLDDIIAKLFQRTLELIPEDFDAPALHALDEAFV
jgi:5'-methylthioadenosine phosphorylase